MCLGGDVKSTVKPTLNQSIWHNARDFVSIQRDRLETFQRPNLRRNSADKIILSEIEEPDGRDRFSALLLTFPALHAMPFAFCSWRS